MKNYVSGTVLSYDEATRPQIVYWPEAINGKGKPESATIDVERVNGMVPRVGRRLSPGTGIRSSPAMDRAVDSRRDAA